MDYEQWLARDVIKSPEKYVGAYRKELFGYYKQAKRIVNGLVDYPVAPIECLPHDRGVLLDCISGKGRLRPVEVVALPGETNHTIADNGFFVFGGRGVSAVVVDCDEVRSDFLDDSYVWALVLGKRVSVIENNSLFQMLRFIHVHKDNAYFRAEHNVLYSKDGTRLIAYAAHKPEEEFTVGREVQVISSIAFLSIPYLKRINIPSHIDRSKLMIALNYKPEICVYD